MSARGKLFSRGSSLDSVTVKYQLYEPQYKKKKRIITEIFLFLGIQTDVSGAGLRNAPVEVLKPLKEVEQLG